MTVCNNCRTAEPRTRAPTSCELAEMGLDAADEDVRICAECDSTEDTLTNYDEDYGADR